MTTCSISSRYSSKHLSNFWYMWSRISENMLLVIAWKNKYSQLILFLQKKISRIHVIHLQVCSFYKILKTATKLQHTTSLGNWKAKREWKLHNNGFFSVPLWVYYSVYWAVNDNFSFRHNALYVWYFMECFEPFRKFYKCTTLWEDVI